jgi:hypothetical protein
LDGFVDLENMYGFPAVTVESGVAVDEYATQKGDEVMYEVIGVEEEYAEEEYEVEDIRAQWVLKILQFRDEVQVLFCGVDDPLESVALYAELLAGQFDGDLIAFELVFEFAG